jgi:hypothetical protein
MSIVGKILAVLNVLAAAGFVYLAASDWGKRENWTYTVYRFDLAMDGLPVDDTQGDPDGTPLVEKLGDKTLQELFKGVGGSPAGKTQLAEVKRVHDKLLQRFQAGDEKTRRDMLLPLARSPGERETIQAAKADQLLNLFEEEFKKPFKQPHEEQPSQKNEPEARRQAIAHLLVNQDLAGSEFERVQVVIGFKAFAAELNSQAAAVRDISQTVAAAIYRDRSAFEKQYRYQIGELQGLAQHLADRAAELQKKNKLVADHEILVKARQTDITDLKDKLEQARQESQKVLKELGAEQKRLFDAQNSVAKALAENAQLERNLRSLEKVDKPVEKAPEKTDKPVEK